jgi:hypothetical protein
MADSNTWLTLGEAVAATGWKPERIRSLARRGTILRKRGNGRDWLYQVTPEVVAARAATRTSTTAGLSAGTDESARWQAVATELQEEVAELWIGLERAAGNDRVAAAEIAARDRTIADLREQVAWLRRPWWQRMFPRSAT